jgi:hypothetical protein
MRDKWYRDNRDLVKWGVLLTLAEQFAAKHILQVLYYRSTDWSGLEVDAEQVPLPPAVIRHFREVAAVSAIRSSAPIRRSRSAQGAARLIRHARPPGSNAVQMPDQIVLLRAFLVAPFAFFTSWVAVLYAISVLGGWRDLSFSYATTITPPGPLMRFRHGRLGTMAAYNASLTLGSSPQGLYLSVFAILRPCHPPLLIPWSDVDTHLQSGRFREYIVFRFAKHPRSTLRLPRALGEELLKMGGSPLPARVVNV